MHSTTLTDNPDISPLERVLFGTARKMSISLLYGALRAVPSMALQELFGFTRETWKRELSVTISATEWENMGLC